MKNYLLLLVISINIFFIISCKIKIIPQSSNKTNFITNKNIGDLETIYSSQKLALSGLINYFKDNGSFEYVYYYSTETFSNNNNMIRQMLASRVLAYFGNNDKNLLSLHKQNLDYYFNNVYFEIDNKAYIFYDNKSKLGANALMLRLLILSPEFEKHKDKAEKLYNGIISLRDNKEGFEPRYIKPDYNYDKDYMLTFYSGEALVSLMEYYNKIKKKEILELAIKIQDYYINKYVENIQTNYYPAYVPWHTISLNLLYKATGNTKYYQAIKIMNNKLLEIQDKGDNKNTYGRFYNPKTPQYGNPHSSSDGVYTEGLVYALEIAYMENDKEYIEKYENAIKIGFENIMNLQYTNTINPNLKGHIKINLDNNNIRIDTTAHSLEAMIKLNEVME